MTSRSAWLSWALVALLPLCAPAAPVAPDQVLRFERLGQDEGLSQGSITAIAQDSFGFVWIGTQDGLNRYDGNEIRIFRPDGSKGALEDSHVRCLLAGPEGALWVGTREGGLARWDPRTETFQTFRSDPKRPDSLSFDYVNSILANDDGTLWVGTLEGLNLFDPKSGKARRFLADKKDPRTLASNEISFLFRDETGLVWVVFKNGAIDTIDTRDASLGICHRKPELAALGTIGNVNAAVNAGGGRVLLGTASGRLLEWTAAGGFTDTADRFVADRPITSLRVEGRALWIGTRGGLLRRDESSARLVTVKPDPADPHSLPSEMVQTLFEDRTGVLWVGTTVGVARLDPASTAFRVYRRSAGHDGPADAYVWAVTSDAAGNLWVGSDGGLSRLDRETGTWRSWAANPSDPGALASDSVTALLVDRAGTLWAGGNRGLSRYDAEADRFTSWLKGAGDPPLRNARVFDLLETKDGSLYVGTGSAAYHFSAGGAAFPRLGGEDLAPSVFAMAEDTDGAIWLGTFHNGLYRVDPRTHASSRLVDAGGKDLIEPQQISSLLVDGKGRLWIGTAKGVFRRDPGAKAVKQYRMRDGLPNDVILGLVEDDEGAIWMSTNGGIAKHDPVAGTFRAYQARDGLPSNEFNQMAAGRTPQGEILFGTPSGMVAFHPGALTKDPRPPQVALTGFELFNAAVPIRPAGAKGEGFALASSILTTKSLVLSHREDVVTLTFAGLHFAAPEEVRYAYRLEGWDKDWNTASARRRSATYTNLPAGRYVFRVRAANKDGVWNEEGVSLALRLLPPPWKTWWAYTAYALLLFGGIAGFFTYRMNALRKRQRDLEALVDVRTKELAESEQRALSANQAKSVFLANMSHELRTPLNAVLGFAQLLDRSPALRGDDRSGLEIIRRSGEHLLGLINDVLSLSKIEAGKLSLEKKPFSLRQMVRGVDAMLRSRADEAGLRFLVEAPGDLPEAVNGDEGKLRQVLVNLLGNAVKFTRGVPNGSVTLRASWNEGRARFEVADTGHGIAAAELATLFSPFVQTESGRKSKEGTGLGLVITREIVRLMDGDLTVTSEPGRGSTFSFEVALPVAEAAPAKAVEGRVVGLAEGETARRVLVADDTPENRLLIVRLLTSVGLEVIEAVNGEEAVRLWEKERPDVVLMDMRMPVLDGREATRMIRDRESRETRLSRTPIVALTASVFEHERDEILASGADDFLMKPFREPQLFRILEERTGVRFRRASGAGAPEPVPAFARSARELVAGLEAGEVAPLRRALEDGDLGAAARAAEEVGRRDAELGDSLLAEIRAFRVDDLLSALETREA